MVVLTKTLLSKAEPLYNYILWGCMSQLNYLIRSFQAHQRFYPAHYVHVVMREGRNDSSGGGRGGRNGVKEGGNGKYRWD